MNSLLISLGLLSFIGCIHADECNKDEIKRCAMPVVMSLEDDGDADCNEMIETRDCLSNLADKCQAENGYEMAVIHNFLTELRAKIGELCKTDEEYQYSDYEEERHTVRQCLEIMMPTTIERCGDEVGRAMGKVQMENINDLRCEAFLRIANCASTYLSNDCEAEEIREDLRNLLILGLKSSKLSSFADSPKCASAIADAEEAEDAEDSQVEMKKRAPV